jgi:hypothetical protein
MGASVLDFFRASKAEPLIQFLTWYLVLVQEWRIEDIASMEFGQWRPAEWGRLLITVNFVLVNGKRESWTVVKNGDIFYVESSRSVTTSTPIVDGSMETVALPAPADIPE